MPRRLFIVNVLVGILGCLLLAILIRELATVRPLPTATTLRAPQSAMERGGEPSGPPPPIATFNVIATKNVFNPGRSEVSDSSAAAAVVSGVKPILHGVLIDGKRSRAYLEEPSGRQVSGYSVGDQIAGGRLEAIEPDRVVIVRPQGRLEVLLKDPSKPQEVTPGVAGPPGQQPIRAPSTSGRAPPPRPPQQPQ